MGGVDQAQVILSQLNATNKVNSKLSLSVLCSVLFCLLWTQIRQPLNETKHRQKMCGGKLGFHKLKILHLKFLVPQVKKKLQLNMSILTADCFQENLAWSRK